MINLFSHDYEGLLPEVPAWVQNALNRRLKKKHLTIVSAVCPDYERCNGKFTYQGIGSGLPYTAERHLDIVAQMSQLLLAHEVSFTYHITLADTEFDLPLVVDHMTGGDKQKFIDSCESSCRALVVAAKQRSLPIKTCGRFTDLFPTWFRHYEVALRQVRREVEESGRVRYDLEINAASRASLYDAMAGRAIGIEYCREMVLRQNAQYMTWGQCAEERFGNSFIMMNHTTSNLRFINHPFMRNGKERIPILQLSITILPE